MPSPRAEIADLLEVAIPPDGTVITISDLHLPPVRTEVSGRSCQTLAQVLTPGGMTPPGTPPIMEGLRPPISPPREDAAKTAAPPALWLGGAAGPAWILGLGPLRAPQKAQTGTATRQYWP